MAKKLSNLDKVLRVLHASILVTQSLAPAEPGKKKRKDALNRAVEAAKLGAGVFLTPRENQAVGLAIDAGVEAYKVAGVFKRDGAPK